MNMEKTFFRKPSTLLQYPLSKKQHIYSCYLVPIVFTCVIYILNFVGDSVLSYQFYRDEDYFYKSATLFWMFAPVLGSFILTVSNLEIWPEERFGIVNIKWVTLRFFQHLFFPVWAMFRFAERLFWTIEAIRCNDDNEIDDLLNRAERNSIFELYHFLQAYLQAAPQILLQLHRIMQHPADFNKSTVDMQVFCIFMSIMKMAMTTMAYQRFNSQKIAGRKYQWEKRILNGPSIAEIRKPVTEESENEKPNETRRNSGLSTTSSQFQLDAAKEKKDLVIPLRVISIRGLTDDDAAGKLVAIFWWFCFILPRMLTLAVFTNVYPHEAVWICMAHYAIVLAFLLYSVNFKDVLHHRIPFIIFISYVYVFCLIEFKVKFKKVKVIYNSYFILVYVQNFILCYVWYVHIDSIDAWWYNYVLYLIVGSSFLSILSMAMYISTLKPEKVTVNRLYRNSQL